MSRPRFADELRLVAIKSAINCAGLFVVSTLTKWGARGILLDAVSVTEELVTNAVKATGIPEERVHWTELTRIEYITVRLLGLEASIRIEVWDSAPNLPVLPDDADSPVKHGCQSAPRGKVVWAELPVRPRTAGPTPDEEPAQDPDLLSRVRDGLDRL
ncbi:MAG: hypothetical protein ACRDTC_20320 [Pseudonocardiaceae bacterium]